MEKMIINGNEFYEIDMECIKRKQDGKECMKPQETARNQPKVPQTEKNSRGKKR